MHPPISARRRGLAALGVAALCLGSLTLAATSVLPASAAVYGNTCTLPAALSPLPFQLSPDIDGTPVVVPDGDSDGVAIAGEDDIRLEDLTADIFVPASIIEAGVSLNIVTPGADLSGTVALTVAAENAGPASQQIQEVGATLGTVTGTFVDGNSDGTFDDPEDTVIADPISSTISFADTPIFSPTGGEVSFTEEALVIVVNVGFSVPITCLPGYTDPGPDGELNDDPETPADETADNGPFIPQTDPFATVAVTGLSSTTTGPSTTSSTTTTTADTTTTSTSSTTTAPPVEYFLPAGRRAVAMSCVGADQATQSLLDSLGDGVIDLSAEVSTSAVTSPSMGESFEMSFTWLMGLDEAVIDTASALGVGVIEISDAELAVGVTAGAAGGDVVGSPATRSLTLAEARSYIEGPFVGEFERTGEIGDPISFVVKPISLTAVVALSGSALDLRLACQPDGPASIDLVDQEGSPPPATTPTTSPGNVVPNVEEDSDPDGAEVLSESAADAARSTLPVTGAAPLGLLAVAFGALDLGYLALSASRPRRRIRAGAA